MVRFVTFYQLYVVRFVTFYQLFRFVTFYILIDVSSLVHT